MEEKIPITQLLSGDQLPNRRANNAWASDVSVCSEEQLGSDRGILRLEEVLVWESHVNDQATKFNCPDGHAAFKSAMSFAWLSRRKIVSEELKGFFSSFLFPFVFVSEFVTSGEYHLGTS